jgi:hypothetical protein
LQRTRRKKDKENIPNDEALSVTSGNADGEGKGSRKPRGPCWNCGETGHLKCDCPKLKEENRKKRVQRMQPYLIQNMRSGLSSTDDGITLRGRARESRQTGIDESSQGACVNQPDNGTIIWEYNTSSILQRMSVSRIEGEKEQETAPKNDSPIVPSDSEVERGTVCPVHIPTAPVPDWAIAITTEGECVDVLHQFWLKKAVATGDE